MDATSPWILGLAIFGVRFIAAEAKFERASRQAQAMEYRPVFGMRLAFNMGLPIFLIGAFQISRQGNLREDWRFVAVFLVFAIGILVFWPSTILVNRSGITESRFMWLKRVSIPWPEIEYVSCESDGNTRIGANDGRSITHTKYHVDPEGFVAELRRHCKLPGVFL